jgi:PAS domain S-box-containing protein
MAATRVTSRRGGVPAETDVDLRAALARLPHVVFRLDRQLRHRFITGAVEKLTKIKPERFLGRTCRELGFAEEVCGPLESACRAVLRTGKPRTVEARVGSVWVLHRLFPERAGPGAARTILGISEDITQAKRAELAVRDSERRYRRLHESIRDAFVSVDMSGRIRECNSVYREMLGYTDAELLKLTYQQITPARWHKMEAKIVAEQILATGSSSVYEKEYRRKDGTIFPVELRTYLVCDDQGQPSRMWAIVRDISERKQAEEALRASEAKCRNVVSNLTEQVTLWELVRTRSGRIRTWRLIDANPATLQIWNKTRAEVVGRLDDDLFPGATRQFRPIVEQIVREGRPHSWESYFPGTDQFLKMTSVPFDHCFITTASDVSDLKRTERALREREEHFRALLKASSDVVYRMSADWNELRLLVGGEFGPGTTPASRSWLQQYIPPDERARVMAAIRKAMRERGVFELEHRVLRADGSQGWTFSRAIPILDADGRVTEWWGTASDITARREAEAGQQALQASLAQRVREQTEALRDQAARLAAILDTATDAIITIDHRGTMQSVNPAAERMFGYERAEMVGWNVAMLMPAPYKDEHDGYLSRYRRTGEKRIIGSGREAQARRKDGSVFPVDLAVSEVVPGELFTGIIRDTSERAAAQQRLRETERMSAIGTLAAGLGHDMNNMLLPLRAHLNAAAAVAGSPEARRRIEQVGQIAEDLQRMAGGLHYLAAEGGSEDSPAQTRLDAWWRRVGPLLSRSVPKGVRVRAVLPRSLPPVAIPAHRLTQAALNLLVNAGQAIRPAAAEAHERRGGRAPERADQRPIATHGARRAGLVTVTARATDGAAPTDQGRTRAVVQFIVRDNGMGMSDEVRRRAFDLFFTTKPRGLGTGLGLPLVARVVQNAGGWVEIDSTPGRGTSVVLNLPVAATSADPATGATRPERTEVSAAISTTHRRADALIRQLLLAAGVQPQEQARPAEASVWVVDPASVRLADARRWLRDGGRARHARVLIVLGPVAPADRAAWKALTPALIDRPDDYASIRLGMRAALDPAGQPALARR